PYALFDDFPTGDYKGKEWITGKYTLTATPYTKEEKGPSLTVSFEVTDTYEITGFSIIDASLDTEVGKLSESDTIEIASFNNHPLSIRADTKPARLGIVTFSLEGPVTHATTEQ